ncbi:sugar efflux transporter [Edwardsiella piscicida]|uniref:sugar efflux transporter n=1 Tax=Edwardsiella piscicida TaxID=1263550 RepID=UPI000D507D20|nr:sugar efflux transporter [Edwardsiella piscicida]
MLTFARTLARRLPDRTGSAFLIVAFLTGIAGALQTPTLSLFLSSQVTGSPLMVGLFYTGSAVIGIIVSQWLASLSDRRGDRKQLILLCCLLGAVGCLLFAYNRNYYLLLIVGVCLTSFGSTANPQMFALAREYADRCSKEAVMFSSVLRAQISLAWVIGPPLAFAMALGWGFTFMYLAATLTFLLCAAIVWRWLPSMPRTAETPRGGAQAPRRNRRQTLLLLACATLMWTCNSMYLINMPLYISHQLQLPERLAGLMMGTAAGLEIPTMLIAGVYAARLGKRRLMLLALVAGLLFYGGLLWITHPWALLALQLLNAVFIGILAGIGMLYFQDLMPGQAGSATTLFTTSGRIGWIIAGSVAGALAEIWSYASVFPVALVMLFIALACLLQMKPDRAVAAP